MQKMLKAASAAFLALVATLVSAAAAGAAPVAPFLFSTGTPDGKMAMASRPASPGAVEIEAADDFVLTAPTAITHASFTGLLTGSGGVQDVSLEIYRVFPLDSNTARTPQVPTRVNSPSDVDFQSRDTMSPGQLVVRTSIVANSFTAANSVLNGIHPLPLQTTGGEGPVTGREVRFATTLLSPFVLPPGHYFFVPRVQTAHPTASAFYWLSAPKPIVAPGTAFPAGQTDLQAWIRNSPLDPDWLRVGTDIVGGNPAPTFNATFALDNAPLAFSFNETPLTAAVGERLSIKAPSAGTVRAFDSTAGHKRPWFDKITVTTKRARTVRLSVVPNAVGRAQLKHKATVHLRARLSFTPTGGRPAKHTVRITWHRR